MRYLLSFLITFPAYAAPVCEEDWNGHKPMKVELVAGAKEKWIKNGTHICTVARLSFSFDMKKVQLDLPEGSDAFLFGLIDLSGQDEENQFYAKEKCQAVDTGPECLIAAYGTIEMYPNWSPRWIIKPVRVDYNW